MDRVVPSAERSSDRGAALVAGPKADRYSPRVANSIARSKLLRAAAANRVLTDGNMCS
jgi:hypothetical protein